ncbi:MAG: HAD hydrolase-like protein, partial [Clostridia bacterium]|nr:HAD hydrolase-like protein [Clostridia bacterium]
METYLFDFDGTLVDSMPSYVSGVLKILDENKVKYDKDIVKIITPLGFEGAAKYFLKTFGLSISVEDLVKKMKDNVVEDYFYHIPAKSNVVCVLKELKERGARLNVLTASPHLTLDACLKRLGIFELFENVWSCEDFSTTKADPKIYHAVAEKLGVKVKEVL